MAEPFHDPSIHPPDPGMPGESSTRPSKSFPALPLLIALVILLSVTAWWFFPKLSWGIPFPKTCGNGKVESWESCDGDIQFQCLSEQTCSDSCDCVFEVRLNTPMPSELCGNGIVDVNSEQCDPPGSLCGEGYVCNSSCVCEPIGPVCGNGEVEAGEMCDGDILIGCFSGQVCANCKCITVQGISQTCGNGVCNTETENSDLCPEDCQCVDDGVCQAGEGAGCKDCGSAGGACGVPCPTGTCTGELQCLNGVCWNDGICSNSDSESNGGENDSCACVQSDPCLPLSSCPGYYDCNGDACRP